MLIQAEMLIIAPSFFLRGYQNLGDSGTLGLIATNTIAQGDTRQTGLDNILIKKWNNISGS